MFYPLATSTWDEKETEALQEVIASGMFTMGARVREYEEAFAKKFGVKHAVMASSGSAANLLAIAATFYHPDFKLERGDEIIVPAVSWSTTYFPVSQLGFKLRFVDIDPHTLNLDLEKTRNAITDRTRGVFAVNLLGNPVHKSQLQSICKDANILLMEDNCESMGARCEGDLAGTFGLFGTFSTFFAHHICTMEGGMVVTNDRKLNDTMRSLRAHGWVRDLPDDTHLPVDPDPFVRQFRFVLPGYNLRPLEMGGATGVHQLKKLDGIVMQRRQNAEVFKELFGGVNYLDIQQETGESSWYGFAIVLKGHMAGRREEVVAALAENGIERRPIMGGNFLNNPVMQHLDHSVGSEITVAEDIDKNGLYLGNSQEEMTERLQKAFEVISSVAE